MVLQKKKMAAFGLLYFFIYLVFPLIAVFVLDLLNVMTFRMDFVIGTIIFGLIGTAITIAKFAYPKETAKNRALRFVIAIYRGIYIFYVFGGFTLGVELGYYEIDSQFIHIILGLKFIAWLLLIIYGINSIKYLLQAIELRGTVKGSITHQKRTKVSIFFKALSIIALFALGAYLGSIIWSGINITPTVSQYPLISYDDNSTPSDYSDDDLNMTVFFSVMNNGFYALRDVWIILEVWTTETTTDPFALPPNQKIGGSIPFYRSKFSSLSDIDHGLVKMYIYEPYLPGLVENYATLEYKITIQSQFAGIYIDADFSVEAPWIPLSLS